MANVTYTTANTSGFIPQFWANRALDVLRQQIVLAGLVAKDVDFTQPGWEGSTITVPYPGTFTATDKVSGTAVTPQAPSGGASVALQLNKHKVVPFLVEDFANAQANMDLMDRYIQPAVIALAEQFETDLWFQMAGTGQSAVLGTQGTGLTASSIRSGMKALNDAKAPAQNRYLAVSTSDQISILGDSNLQNFFAFSQPQRVINGFMGRLYNMDTFWTQMVPQGYLFTQATSGTYTITVNGQTTSAIARGQTALQLQGILEGLSSVGAGHVKVAGPTGGPYTVFFDSTVTGLPPTQSGTGASFGSLANLNYAFQEQAIMFAVRPFPATPSDAGVHSAQAADQESGLSIRISAQYDINNVGMRVNLDMLYGAVVLRPTQAVPIIS